MKLDWIEEKYFLFHLKRTQGQIAKEVDHLFTFNTYMVKLY